MSDQSEHILNHLPTDRRALLAGIGGLAAGTFLTAGRAEAGPLNPPAAPASTPGPEPRIAINAQNTPGGSSYVHHIEKSGSYYLTRNLDGSAGRSGIVITSDCVTIDLNGFCMNGTTGALTGILSGSNVKHIAIYNGMIQGWPGGGISLLAGGSARNLRVERVIVADCGNTAIHLGNNAIVADCTCQGNAGIGIKTGDNCIIRNCACRLGTEGIVTGSTSLVSRCLVRENQIGISVHAASQVESCVARVNTAVGIRLNSECLGLSNVCMGATPEGTGLEVIGNYTRIEGNTCSVNGIGIRVNGIGNFIARNTCSANGTNWNIDANNVAGPILDRRAPASAAIIGHSAPDSTGTTHPWANFTL